MKTRNILLAIIAAAFIIRFFYFLTLGEDLQFPDSARYDRLAREIIAGEGYRTTSTAPLYPLFLAGVYAAFGHSFFAVRTAQAFVECASVIIVFLLAKGAFGGRAGLTAAGIFAVYPFFIFFSGLILTETLFIFLLLALMYHLKKCVSAPSAGSAAACGFIGGAIILIKPVIFYFIPLALLFYIISEREKRIPLLKSSALIILLVPLAASPWAVYNYIEHGTPKLFPSASVTLYESLHPGATGGPGKEFIRWTEEMKRMDEAELEKYFRREALKFIAENPWRTLQLAFIKQARFWSPIPNFPEYRDIKHGAAGFLSYMPVLFLAIWLVVSEKQRWKTFSHLCIPIIYFAILHTVILGSIRYRLPVDPFIIILASGKIEALARQRS